MRTEKKKVVYYKSKGFDVIEIRDKNIGNIEDYLQDQIRLVNRKYNK